MAQYQDRHWLKPDDGGREPCLRLYNSCVDEKVPFIPCDGPESKSISWYTCGPTVYDSAHLGHARNYVTFDIVRRVLEDYFGYDIKYVMNVTDVDDKIILRARRNYLFEIFMKDGHSVESMLDHASSAIQEAVAKQTAKLEKALAGVEAAKAAADSRQTKELQGQADGEQLKLGKLQQTAVKVQGWVASPGDATLDAVVAEVRDVLSEKLDAEKGASVTDKSIYRAHAARYEAEFLDDMRALGVRDADVMTRVTDYMPEVVAFVQQIEANGLAYRSAAANGSSASVYFDVAAFKARGHHYGKLKPWAVGSAALAAEGESNFTTSEKRSPQDFVLWKASKAGEPSWESPWGPGRPGWHIECSAMAHAVLGDRMDIHSGGEDLKFPHHDNEVAQTEAFLHSEGGDGCATCAGCKQWVNYFLHSGHLAIDGLKMSKSLKNFVTIQEALEQFSARQIRLLFCLAPWHRPMTFNATSREEMVQKEATLKNFFLNVQVALRGAPLGAVSTARCAADTALGAAIDACQRRVHAALLDNINTALALSELLELGIRLEDKPQGAVWKRDNPDDLKREIRERKRAAAQAAVDKVAAKLRMSEDELAKAAEVLKFGSAAEKLADRLRFDGDGAPTHEKADGGDWVELDDKRKKAVSKIVQKEEKARAPVMKKVEKDPQYLENLKSAVAELSEQLKALEADMDV